MHTHLPFNYKKATQCINYFARQSGGRINKLKMIKLLFFADRYHLRKYGRLITNGQYYAMDHGPVHGGVKDLAEMSAFLRECESRYAEPYIKPDQYDVLSLRDIDEAVFSETDLEALEFAWKKLGELDVFDLRDLTHQYPEWKHCEQALQEQSRVLIDYKYFLDDPPPGYDKCFALNDEEKQDRLEQIEEATRINALWT